MKYFVILLAVTGICLINCSKPVKEIVEQVKSCYNNDKSKLDQCVLEYFKALGPLLGPGIKELDVPNLDPAALSKVDFPEDSALVQGKAFFDQLKIEGLSKYKIGSVVVDRSKRTVACNVSYPQLEVNGIYDFDGTMFVVPVKGSGNYSMTMDDVDSQVVIHVERDGLGIRLAKMDVDFTIGNATMRLDALLGEGDVTGDSINKLMNDNSGDIIKELKPTLNAKLSETLSRVLANVVKELPVDPFS